MRHSFMYALLIGITSILSLENGTVPKFVEKTVFLLAHLSVSQFYPLGTFCPTFAGLYAVKSYTYNYSAIFGQNKHH